MANKLRLRKIEVPEKEENYYFINFTSGDHETEDILERHDIDVEVMVEGRVPLGEVKRVAEERAIRFLKKLAETL